MALTNVLSFRAAVAVPTSLKAGDRRAQPVAAPFQARVQIGGGGFLVTLSRGRCFPTSIRCAVRSLDQRRAHRTGSFCSAYLPASKTDLKCDQSVNLFECIALRLALRHPSALLPLPVRMYIGSGACDMDCKSVGNNNAAWRVGVY